MSQQINLRRAKADPKAAAAMAVGAVLASVILVLGYAVNTTLQTNHLRAQAVLGEARVVQLRNAVAEAQKKSKAVGDSGLLTAEIADLQARASAISRIVSDVQAGQMGSPDGFVRHFNALAALPHDDVWLTDITIGKGGITAMQVRGRALGSEAVIQYARRLNESMAPLGVRFQAVDILPDVLAPNGAPLSVAFKLS